MKNETGRRVIMAAVAALGLIVTGCATPHQHLALGVVGPAPMAAPAPASANGSLLVFSACVAVTEFDPISQSTSSASMGANNSDACAWSYTRYKILNPDGKVLRSVKNNVGNPIPHPRQIELQPGRYSILADSASYGRVNVPVQIVAGQMTVLHLDGNGVWPREDRPGETNSVRLPNGKIIGWRFGAVASATP